FYEEQNDYDNMIKYYLMLIDHDPVQKINITKEINKYLHKNKNIEHLLQCQEYLNKNNLKYFNDMLKIYYDVHEHYELNNISIKEECCICYEEKYNIKLFCKHKICHHCYN